MRGLSRCKTSLYRICGGELLTPLYSPLFKWAVQLWHGFKGEFGLSSKALCYLLIKVRSLDNGWSLAAAIFCHVTATWSTNMSMACMFASSTFAIKLMEPITSAVVQFAILGTPLSPLAIISLPVIVGGAMMFSGNPLHETSLSIGTAAAFSSNIILALRNVALKLSAAKQSGKDMTLQPVSRSVMTVALVCAAGGGMAWTYGYLGDRTVFNVATCVLSGVFHVLYSYVSTGIVLAHLSVVSHAVSNILKRVLVVLLLYGTGTRIATAANFLGLAICTAGLLVYAWSKRSSSDHKHEDLSKSRITSGLVAKATLFVLVLAVLVGALSFIVVKRTQSSIPETLYRLPPLYPEPVNDMPVAGGNSRFERTFTHQAHDKPRAEDLLPDFDGYLAEDADNIQAFLQEDLYSNPNRSSFLSRKLRTHVEIVKEAQRLHFDILGEVLKKFKYAMLLDIASFENKGDPCITVGEIYFLARIELEIVYYCSAASCSDGNLRKAAEKAKTYSIDELVILVHGGGNVVGYAFSDIHRFFIFEYFQNYKIFIFPQSIWVRDFNYNHPHFKRCALKYCCNENVTFVMRDHLSYSIAREHFAGKTKFILAPDMAFQIGPVERFMSPVFDIMWIRRGDGETPGYKQIPDPPPGVRLHVSDWWKWLTPRAPSSLEKAFYICTNGFFYLQRGRVVITDRLHGHILATLLNIPHVVIDNKVHKLSAYHLSWTAGLENTVITDDPKKAVDLAVELLHRYNSSLPPRIPFLHIDEFHIQDKTFEKPNMMFT